MICPALPSVNHLHIFCFPLLSDIINQQPIRTQHFSWGPIRAQFQCHVSRDWPITAQTHVPAHYNKQTFVTIYTTTKQTRSSAPVFLIINFIIFLKFIQSTDSNGAVVICKILIKWVRGRSILWTKWFSSASVICLLSWICYKKWFYRQKIKIFLLFPNIFGGLFYWVIGSHILCLFR